MAVAVCLQEGIHQPIREHTFQNSHDLGRRSNAIPDSRLTRLQCVNYGLQYSFRGECEACILHFIEALLHAQISIAEHTVVTVYILLEHAIGILTKETRNWSRLYQAELHATSGMFESHGVSETLERIFTGIVCAAKSEANKAENRTDLDDPPFPMGQHHRQNGIGEVLSAKYVGLELLS